MELGTTRPGTLAPALVAFVVLAGSVALAATQEPAPPEPPAAPTSAPDPASPSLTPVPAWRGAHRAAAAPLRPVVTDRPSPRVVAGCAEAVAGGDLALERARGLDRAIQAILERCGRGAPTHGLLNALQRLQENRARHEQRGGPGRGGNPHGQGQGTGGGGVGPTDPPGGGGHSDEEHGGGPSGTQGGGPTEVRDAPGPSNGHGVGPR